MQSRGDGALFPAPRSVMEGRAQCEQVGGGGTLVPTAVTPRHEPPVTILLSDGSSHGKDLALGSAGLGLIHPCPGTAGVSAGRLGPAP